MIRILIIEDEPQIRRFLNISLGSQGYEILEAADGQTGLQQTALINPELIVLDLGLPDMDGQEVLKSLRDFYQGPIIVLSVRNSEKEKVTALDNGCNDYVEKPFAVNELLARIRAVLRTFSGIEKPPSSYDDRHLKVDLLNRRVVLADQEVHLSKKEFELLKMLISYSGKIITQQQLLRDIWGLHHTEDTHYLRVVIGRLRRKLGDDPTEPKYIETLAGVGYRFIGMDGNSAENA